MSRLRLNMFVLLCALLVVIAAAAQAIDNFRPGVGTVNYLNATVVKVTTNPTGAMNAQDIQGPVGGDTVSIYVDVLYGTAVTNIDSVVVNLQEQNVTASAGTITLTTFTQLDDSGSGNSLQHERVYTTTWNSLTTTPLMIYNDNYCFIATIGYHMNGVTISPSFVSDIVVIPIKNMVIKSISVITSPISPNTDNYFLVSPGTTSGIPFTISLDDYTTTAQYSYELSIRATETSTVELKNIPGTGNGLSQSMSWDLTDNEGDFFGNIGGYYTFELTVSKTLPSGVIDTQTYRSTTLTCTQDSISFQTDGNGNIVTLDNGNTNAIFQFQLSQPPCRLLIAPYSPAMNVDYFVDLGYISSASSSNYLTGTNSINVWGNFGTPPDARGILTAWDNNASNYRDQLPRRMLCCNSRMPAYTKSAALSFGLVTKGIVPDFFVQWIQSGPPTVLHPENLWAANTGRVSNINSDYYQDYWTNRGPIPDSNHLVNEVLENSHTATHCYNITYFKDPHGHIHEWATSDQLSNPYTWAIRSKSAREAAATAREDCGTVWRCLPAQASGYSVSSAVSIR